MDRHNTICRGALGSLPLLALVATFSWGANQTATVSPLQPADGLPYRIEVREADFSSVDLPTLHSFAVGRFDNKWLFISGRTNGLHGFNSMQFPGENFPEEFQNRDVWVVDLASKQSWSRPLDEPGSGLEASQVLSLAATNNQFYQKNNTLYVTGGYGILENGVDYTTFDALSAINVPGLANWVMNGTGSAAENIRQIQDPVFSVTGGAMHEIGGRTHLVFGQDFEGDYFPSANGTYTRQVRSFEIVDVGMNLSVENITATPLVPDYRRRDLNIVPILSPDGAGGVAEKLLALSGVFTESFGAWTVPVEIDAAGLPTMADPDAADTFKQGFNGYHSAKLGLYSQSSGAMHEMLFGGISLQYLDETTGTVMTDAALPFVNDITAIQIDALGQYTQHHLGYFPELLDTSGLRLRFGASAEFLTLPEVPVFANGIIDFDQLAAGETILGHIFGGIVTNGPHTRRGADSSGSNQVFEVVIILVPEPTGVTLATLLICVSLPLSRQRHGGSQPEWNRGFL